MDFPLAQDDIPVSQNFPAGPENFPTGPGNYSGGVRNPPAGARFLLGNRWFTFGIPQGNPWEVSFGDLNTAMSTVTTGSSAASNGVELLQPTNPNPTLMDVAEEVAAR